MMTMSVVAMLFNEVGREECNRGASISCKRACEPVAMMNVFVFVGRKVRRRLEVK